MVDILGKLSFYDSGSLSGSFSCACGSNISFDGIPEYHHDDIEQEPGFTLWCFKGDEQRYSEHSREIVCMFCDRIFKLQPVIALKTSDE